MTGTLNELPFTLAAGASRTIEVKADTIYLDVGPTVSGSLALRLDELPELDVRQGFTLRFTPFERITLRNKSLAALTGHLVYSLGDLFAFQPGAGGGLTDIIAPTRQAHVRHYPWAAANISSGSAGSTTTFRNPVVEMSTGAVGINNWREAVEATNTRQMYRKVGTEFWDRRHLVRARMLVYGVNNGDVGSEAGIVIGLAGAHPLAGGGANYLRLCAAEMGLNAHWELHVRNAGFYTRTTLSGVDAFVLGVSYDLEIEYNPGVNVIGRINGTAGVTQTVNLPAAGATEQRGFGIFTGSDASALDSVQAAFVCGEAWTFA